MRIAKLLPSEKIPGRWLIWLDDGALVRVSENEVAAFSLYAGMELPDETYEALAAAAQVSEMKEKALSLLTGRPMSRRELMDRLSAERGNRAAAPRLETAEAVADRLEELGYLDDAAYARTVARHYAAKGYGERKIRDELYRRGVDRALWDEALEEAGTPEEGIDLFLQKKFGGQVPDEKERRRAFDALVRRGFRWEDIQDGLRRYGAEIEE